MDDKRRDITTVKKDTIQYMRAIAIILVVLQHAVIAMISGRTAVLISSICFSIDVNVFMFISGYLYESSIDKYNRLGKASFLKGKAASLMIPYLFWEVLLYAGAWFIYNGPEGINKLSPILERIGFSKLSIPEIVVSLITFNDSYVELYWFLYVLFLIFVINCILGKLIINRIGIISIVILLPFLLLFADAVYIINKLAVGLLVFVAGRLFSVKKIKFSEINFKHMILSVLAFGILFKSRDITNVFYIEQLWYLAKSTILGLLGIIVVIWIAEHIGKVQGISNAAMLVGNYSLSIYLLHNPWVIKLLSMVFPSGGVRLALVMRNFRNCNTNFD